MADETEDWTPDKEKEDDPAKLQKEAIKVQKEGLAFYKGILEEQKRKEEEAKEAYLTSPSPSFGVVRALRGFPPPPKQVILQVKKIKNGWILAKFHAPGGSYPEDAAEEIFFATIDELVAGSEREIRVFTAKAMGDVPEGT